MESQNLRVVDETTDNVISSDENRDSESPDNFRNSESPQLDEVSEPRQSSEPELGQATETARSGQTQNNKFNIKKEEIEEIDGKVTLIFTLPRTFIVYNY